MSEPVKSEGLTNTLRIILENHPQVTSLEPFDGADFRVTLENYSDPLFFNIQTNIKKNPNIGFYELFVFKGSPSVLSMHGFGVYAGKSIQNTVTSFFENFNNKN